MNKKHTAQSAFFNLRILITLLLCAVAACSLVSRPLLAFFRPEASTKDSQRPLTFAERVTYRRAIEEVYWLHRIWPKERPDPKPSLDAVMSQAQLEKKVEDYLRKSQALEDYWHRPIAGEQLQAEMDRMARDTKQPDVLRELFEALGNDPFVIAECLARPTLVEREFATAESRTPSPEGSRAKGQSERRYVSNAAYVLPTISSVESGCTPDSWTFTSTTNAAKLYDQIAVWTGSEMIVWGGIEFSMYTKIGRRYNPATNSWTATSTTNAPSARYIHTAVWTGSEMIVWGGLGFGVLNSGGRYDPGTDTWTATSTTNAPSARYSHKAVWTGSEMIVWGGTDDGGFTNFNTGGRYDPDTDSWTATSITNAPSGRDLHTAVWTGSEMIVWGGAGENEIPLNTGGRYNSSTDSWTATSTTGAPSARFVHTAVWTGSEMVVWGGWDGDSSNTGGRYDPSTDSWTGTSTTSAPDSRFYHTAIWTGSQMIVWGGTDDGGFTNFNTGGRYGPDTDSWTATSTTNAPVGRISHTAVWTGNEMIVWGGRASGNGHLNTGGRYCAQSGTPTPSPTPTPAPTATATPTSSPTPTCAGCSVTSPSCDTTVFSPPTDFIVRLNPPGPDGLQANDFTVNAIPSDNFMIVSGGAEIHFYFNTSPAMQGENTIHIAACAFFCAGGSVPEFTCTFLYEPSTPTPTPTPTSTPRSTPTPRIRPTPPPRPTPAPRP